MINSESFVLYESTFKQFERLVNRGKKEEALAFIKATMEYGLYGVIPDEEDEVWDYGLEQTFTSISAAKDRRAWQVENGKKGGRPTIELNEAEVIAKKEELKTWKAVAMFFGVTEQTLRNKRTEWEKQKNPKNLNVNVNVNDNVNDNDNVKEKTSSNFFGSLEEEKISASNMKDYVEKYRALNRYIESDGAGADKMEELLDTACYFNNPEERIKQMAAAELQQLEDYYNKYCFKKKVPFKPVWDSNTSDVQMTCKAY